MADGWSEVGAKQSPAVPATNEVLAVPNPMDNKDYARITSDLRKMHGDLLKFEQEGRLNNAAENPGLIGDYLGKLRLNANMLFSFLNAYIDIEIDLSKELNNKRQALYEQRLSEPKGSPSSAETHSKAMTKADEASVKIVQNRIQQIKNEYERYNGICMYLQSRLKEFNTERMMP